MSEPDSETLKVVFTAMMVKEKGVIEQIEAAEKLRKDYEGWGELISGSCQGLCGFGAEVAHTD